MSNQGMKRMNNDSGSGGGAKKMRGDSVTLRFLLMSKHAGGIIGKGGQTIKRLRSEYSATVNVPDSNSSERVLSIAASQENAIKILCECLPLFHEPPYQVSGGGSQNQKNEFEVDFLVHSSQVGGIIGRSGFKIKELREQTNANVKVFQECLPNSTERVVALGGGEAEIVDALKKILEIMQESPIKGNIALYDPSQEWNGGQDNYSGSPMNNMRSGPLLGRGNNRSGMGRSGGRSGFQGGNFGQQGGGFGRAGGSHGGSFQNDFSGGQEFGGGGFNNSQSFNDFNSQGSGNGGDSIFGQGDIQTTQVTIPNDLAGAIIGRGGERIRNIRQRSGADIKIQDPGEGKNDRVITITGTQDQIQYGQFLMQQSVRQYSGKKMGGQL
ncbi:heterogeneous nuclear ribonucleoprotein K isoform X4 [Hydra vulgaris]|uniref:Heterogeneous nuclear ribonucleoprotein K isoform X4 n=1 Tax=Hydra vulgaris TaxID=6087 RepID=A0ABM4D9F2_HYDVU